MTGPAASVRQAASVSAGYAGRRSANLFRVGFSGASHGWSSEILKIADLATGSHQRHADPVGLGGEVEALELVAGVLPHEPERTARLARLPELERVNAQGFVRTDGEHLHRTMDASGGALLQGATRRLVESRLGPGGRFDGTRVSAGGRTRGAARGVQTPAQGGELVVEVHVLECAPLERALADRQHALHSLQDPAPADAGGEGCVEEQHE